MQANRDIYSVTRLNTEVKMVLEGSFPLLWVEGEISNFARPASGHWYLSLKDSHAQVSCAMFRNRNSNLRFKPANGQKVLVRARISLFEARGNYQLILDHMEPAGDGALQRAFEELKNKLEKEGLFAEQGKRPLPRFPARIGVISSDSGAALRDVLSVLKRRYPVAAVRIFPVPVQGDQAAGRIVDAINKASIRKDCDVLILTRGGGSLEDLQAFNDERVARAIAACEVPLVAAIGHEIDFTIADFVADLRAPTPSAAAELVTPDSQELLRQFQDLEQTLGKLIAYHNQDQGKRLRHLLTRLQQHHPERRIETSAQRVDEFETRLARTMQAQTRQHRQQLEFLQRRLHQQHPKQLLASRQDRLDNLRRRLARQMQADLHHSRTTLESLHRQMMGSSPSHRLSRAGDHVGELFSRLSLAGRQAIRSSEQRLRLLSRGLDIVSPLATLDRGYAIARDKMAGAIVHDSATVQIDDEVEVHLAKGRLDCRVFRKT